MTQCKLHFCSQCYFIIFFTFLIYVHTCHANFDFNRCPISSHQHQKGFEWSKSFLVNLTNYPIKEISLSKISFLLRTSERYLEKPCCIILGKNEFLIVANKVVCVEKMHTQIDIYEKLYIVCTICRSQVITITLRVGRALTNISRFKGKPSSFRSDLSYIYLFQILQLQTLQYLCISCKRF